MNTSTAGRTQRPSVSFHSGLTPPTSPPSPPPPSTPPLLPYGGHLSPQNPHCLSHPQAHDYSKSAVTRLILDGKLAPFYRGLEDFEEDWTEEDIGRILTEMREKDYAEGVANSCTERLKEEREGGSSLGNMTKKMGIHKNKELRREGEKEERERRERRAYLSAVECPICFLNYPPNINTSRCCQQPVCTECFVQIKRSDATITHLESEPACCPFCVETEFGVIYERPPTPMSSLSSTALATSPNDTGTSYYSHAFSAGSDAELAIGPGMNPIQKETIRRKSVSSKAKEVVTIDEIRPDWEHKLNAVKAAAARRASRRIIMRQVGDRLIPIGYTSSRAPGTADFSMSLPPIQNGGGADESGSSPRRLSRRRESNREREIEELMIMEAMRLSLLDHEEHQRRQADDLRENSTTADVVPSIPPSDTANTSTAIQSPGPPPGPSTGAAFAATAPSTSSSTGTPRRLSGQSDKNDKQSGASKLLSKFSNVRARANSATSSKGHGSGDFKNTFGRTRGNSGSTQTPSPSPALVTTQTSASASTSNSAVSSTAPSPIPSISPLTTSHTQPQVKTSVPTHSGGLSPTTSTPAAPITTLASPGASGKNSGEADLLGGPNGPTTRADVPVGLPHLSIDMPTLTPEAPGKRVAAPAITTASTGVVHSEGDLETTFSNYGTAPLPSTLSASSWTPRVGLQRSHSDITEVTEPEAEGNGPRYTHLDSD